MGAGGTATKRAEPPINQRPGRSANIPTPFPMKTILFTLPLVLLSIFPAAGDTLQPLGDEFNDAATLARWKDLDVVEGWVASTHESADINTSTPGRFRIVPIAWGWYMHVRGALFFKEVTGDFIATTRLRVFSRHNAANPMEV